MKSRYLLAFACCGMVFVSSSCRKDKTESTNDFVPVAVMAPELLSNGLKSLPGAVYRSQIDSPIHWQPWTKESLKRAKDAHRLVFAMIAMPQQIGFKKILESMNGEPTLVANINDHYVPILIDGDASRELGILTADLCSEIKRPLQLPLFLWMTYDGNPVAWIPVTKTDPASVLDLFNQSHTMVSKIWTDDSAYVLKNSGMDNSYRRDRVGVRKNAKVMSTQPAVDVVSCIRHLSSSYDPYSRNLYDAGGLFPSGTIELLATAAIHPGLPPSVRSHALTTTRDLLADLLHSPMFDPLNGGVFSSRRGVSWSLPSFAQDCSGQARIAVALIQAFRATGDQEVLDKALELIAFSEKSYATSEGLFSVGLTQDFLPEHWMWRIEDVETALGPEDAAWWIKATDMKKLGNLLPEVDPRREFFRCNTLGLTQSIAQIAAEQSQSLESFTPRFNAAKNKLLAVRNARLGAIERDESSHAGATFRMVSAYAAAFGVTGDERFRKKAIALLELAQKAFGVGPYLRTFSKDAPDSIGAGRAFHYALALQAVLDVATITSDDHWLFWAEDMATTAAELFTSNEFLKECSDNSKLIDVPITDLVMLFDDSTAGLVSLDECRLAELGRLLVQNFSKLATPMPVYALDRPVLHTDLLLATLARQFRITVVIGTNISPALKLATERLQMRIIQHRMAQPEDQVPDGSIKILLSHGESRIVSTPTALQDAVLPSPEK